MGDPLMGVTAGPGSFTINNYGGSAWRWEANFTFNYSRIDKTWQLVRVEHESFHAMNPDKVKQSVERPPYDFGKIDIADFDADNYEGRGQGFTPRFKKSRNKK